MRGACVGARWGVGCAPNCCLARSRAGASLRSARPWDLCWGGGKCQRATASYAQRRAEVRDTCYANAHQGSGTPIETCGGAGVAGRSGIRAEGVRARAERQSVRARARGERRERQEARALQLSVGWSNALTAI